MTRTAEFDIALSFAGEDRTYVEQVANLLRDSGVSVFYDRFEEANLWGKNLYDYLSDVYQNKALYTIMFISESYLQKLWTNHERMAMQARAFQEHKEYVLPARFDETAIPGVLPTVGYISLAERTPQDFVKIIQAKLVSSGHTIPSKSVRRTMFSVSRVPRVDPIHAQVSVIASNGLPVAAATVTAIADNGTTKNGLTSTDGLVELSISTRRLYKLLVAHPEHLGAVIQSWDPSDDLAITLADSKGTGSIICHSTGYIPGFEGRLNPILDAHNRMYLYAKDIAIGGGVQQPAKFQIDVPFELEDSNGSVIELRVLVIQGETSLLQYVFPQCIDG